MVYAEVVLGKRVDWTTINIQTNSNMKAPLSPFFGSGRKFPNGGLTMKMPSKTSTPNDMVEYSPNDMVKYSPNDMVEYSPTSSNNEKTGCTPIVRRAILNSIKGRVVHNTLTEMVPMSSLRSHFFSKPLRGGIMDMERKGRVVDLPWMRVSPTWRSLVILLIRLQNWNKN
jgi:hypothetical protein